MEDQNYTIKDIARMAGVSAGTVDRVLHNRGDVSPKSKAKVQKVLDEIHYQPNVFAIGLAAKKKYSFLCLIPYYIEHDYWHSVVGGIAFTGLYVCSSFLLNGHPVNLWLGGCHRPDDDSDFSASRLSPCRCRCGHCDTDLGSLL